jgi:hypothetical protein
LQDEAQEGFDGPYRDFYLMGRTLDVPPNDVEAYMPIFIAKEWEELNREC